MILAEGGLSLDETKQSIALLERWKAQGFSAMQLQAIGGPSKVLLEAQRSIGLKSILLLKQGEDDAPYEGGDPDVWAEKTWKKYQTFGYRPDDFVGICISDEPMMYHDEPLTTLAEKQSHSQAAARRMAASMVALRKFVGPEPYLWFNSNSPSGRLYDGERSSHPRPHKGRSAIDHLYFGEIAANDRDTWSLETWQGDDGSVCVIEAFSTLHEAVKRPLIVYAVGQHSGERFSDVLRTAEKRQCVMTVVYKFGPPYLGQNQDAYALTHRKLVWDGIAKWKAMPRLSNVHQMPVKQAMVMWPYQEHEEKRTEEYNLAHLHPVEADRADNLEAEATVLIHRLRDLPIGWTKDDSKALYDFRSAPDDIYPISNVGPNLPGRPVVTALDDSHWVHAGIKLWRYKALRWMYEVNKSEKPLQEARSLPHIASLEAEVVKPTMELLKDEPAPVEEPVDDYRVKYETLAAKVRELAAGL